MDSQLPLREQEEVISVLNPHNFGCNPSIINVKTQTDSEHSSDKQNKMFCDVSRAEDNVYICYKYIRTAIQPYTETKILYL